MSGLGLLGVALWARFQRIFYTRTTKDAAARLKKRQVTPPPAPVALPLWHPLTTLLHKGDVCVLAA